MVVSSSTCVCYFEIQVYKQDSHLHQSLEFVNGCCHWQTSRLNFTHCMYFSSLVGTAQVHPGSRSGALASWGPRICWDTEHSSLVITKKLKSRVCVQGFVPSGDGVHVLSCEGEVEVGTFLCLWFSSLGRTHNQKNCSKQLVVRRLWGQTQGKVPKYISALWCASFGCLWFRACAQTSWFLAIIANRTSTMHVLDQHSCVGVETGKAGKIRFNRQNTALLVSNLNGLLKPTSEIPCTSREADLVYHISAALKQGAARTASDSCTRSKLVSRREEVRNTHLSVHLFCPQEFRSHPHVVVGYKSIIVSLRESDTALVSNCTTGRTGKEGAKRKTILFAFCRQRFVFVLLCSSTCCQISSFLTDTCSVCGVICLAMAFVRGVQPDFQAALTQQTDVSLLKRMLEKEVVMGRIIKTMIVINKSTFTQNFRKTDAWA